MQRASGEPSVREVRTDAIVIAPMAADRAEPREIETLLIEKLAAARAGRRLRVPNPGEVLNMLAFCLGLGLLVAVASCADASTGADDGDSATAVNDPIEPANRAVFDANQLVDQTLFKPVARAYADDLPDLVRAGLHNFFGNLHAPAVAANHALQGDFGLAGETVVRFLANSTVGGIGFVDVASGWGLPRRDADFGETLGVWGLDGGPFLELPLLGPSNLRDALGTGIDIVMDPFTWVSGSAATDFSYARLGTEALDKRADLLPVTDDVDRNALDPYAHYRSLYQQSRAAVVGKAKAKLAPADTE